MPLVFDRLPEVNEEGSQWTDCELTDAINLVHKNLEKLNSYLSVMVSVAVVYVSPANILIDRNHLSFEIKPEIFPSCISFLTGWQTSKAKEDDSVLGPIYLWCSWAFCFFYMATTS